MQLYSFWRSQAAFRVRIALGLKGLHVEMTYVDLFKDAQAQSAYRRLNPAMLVPTLVDGQGPSLVQSLAIIEYLDEVYPQPRLLPMDPRDRAYVRALAQIVAVDAHPFLVPRVRHYMQTKLNLNEQNWIPWIRHWLDTGTSLMEEMLTQDRRTGRFCYGDFPSLADVCLVPHLTSAQMNGCSFDNQSTVQRIFGECMKIPAFSAAHPNQQLDRP